jgi:hypothetical protein
MNAISFSPAMAAALLAGRKTMTRRLLSPQPPEGAWPYYTKDQRITLELQSWVDPAGTQHRPGTDGFPAAPYSKGELLWVRETHYRFGFWERDPDKPQDKPRGRWRFVPMGETMFSLPRFTGDVRQGPPREGHGTPALYRRPARFMFKADARMHLEVLQCDAQRLQAISEWDAQLEGIVGLSKDGKLRKFGIADLDGLPGNDNVGWHWKEWRKTPREAFAELWDSIHGPTAWALNPWVSATTFTPHFR